MAATATTSKNTTRSDLSDVLMLYTTKCDDPMSFTYEIEITTFKSCKFTLNFEGSENFAIEGNGDNLVLQKTIKPFTKQHMGKLFLVDEDKRASLKMSCEWTMEAPDEKETEAYMKPHLANLAKIIADAKTLHFPSQIDDPDAEKVKAACSSYGKPFIDLDFLPSTESLFKVSGAGSSAGMSGEENGKKRQLIEWKRPKDFMQGDFFVFEGGILPSDIRQGALGNCWFLCAIAALTEFPQLVEDLFPIDSKEKNDAGVYNVKLCKNGTWQNVRVDDMFPCYPGGGPIYSRSNGNELWVILLEKAFAKIHGSYAAIKSGWAYEAMMDLTGAPYKTIRFEDPDLQAKISNGELWAELMKYDLENFIMSASTPGEDTQTETGRRQKSNTGLVAGHAYSLISVKQSRKGPKLVKLRNPWGSMEWNGDWSDSSPLWTAEMQAEIEPLVASDDGTFWMSFEDLLKHFFSVNVCMVRHAGLNKTPWIEARRPFFYEYHAEALDANSRVTSPLFVLTVLKPGKFIVAVHQHDARCVDALPYIDIGVTVMNTNPVYGTFSLVKGTGNSVDRQNQTEEFNLTPGKYVIVPTSTGCKLKEHIEETQRKKAEAGGAAAEKIKLVQQNANGEPEFTHDTIRLYTEVYERIDLDGDGQLNKAELDSFMMKTEGTPIDEKAFMWLLHNFESKDKVGLTLAGFIKAQLFVFKHTGGDEEKLRAEFKLLGYDDDLQYHIGRAAVLSVHGTGDFFVESKPFDANAFEEGVELPIMAQGTSQSFEDGKLVLHKHRSGYCGLSFVIENKNVFPVTFNLDCSQSENVCSHRGSLVHQLTCPPGEAKVLHHLMPANPEESLWTWAYNASYMWEDPEDA